MKLKSKTVAKSKKKTKALFKPKQKQKTKKIIPHLLKKSAEIRAFNFKKIEENIDKCKGDIHLLASLCGVDKRTIYSHLKNPDNISAKKRFDEQRIIYGTHPEIKEKIKREKIIEYLKKFGGSISAAAMNYGTSHNYLCRVINADEEFSKIRDEEREKKKQSKQEEIQKRTEEENAKKMEIFNHDEIDESKFLPHQNEFAALAPDYVKHPALIGGYGSGKTMSIPLRWLRLIDFRTAQNKKCDMMILEPTNEMVRDILLPLFDEFFASLNIRTKWSITHRNYSIYYHGEVHTAMLRSADKPRNLTGKNLSDIIIDEFDKIPYAKQKVVWRECISRIRKVEHGTAAVVTTPEGFKMTYELWGRS